MKSIKYYNSFRYRFTKHIKRAWFKYLLKRDKLIKVDDRHRGVGKTYMMIDRAISEDIPIVVGTKQQATLIKKDGNPVDIIVFNSSNMNSMHGRRFKNGLMIDESLEPDMIPEIKKLGYKLRGGFIQNYNKNK